MFWLIIQVPLTEICFAALDIKGNLFDLLIFVIHDSTGINTTLPTMPMCYTPIIHNPYNIPIIPRATS
jgi:hypothetical protein